jgi:hypothetical protein
MNATYRPHRLLALLLAASFAAGPALSQPPWAGGGGKGEEKHEGKGKKSKADKHASDDVGKGKNMARKPLQPGAYFNDNSRHAVQTYYASAGKGGKGCPPGLAKKNNGCMPPGQAKKQWNIGQPLPSTVVLHPVPSQIIVSLPPVPVGHKYVQVAGDILLIAVGSKMVVDGINGLMR